MPSKWIWKIIFDKRRTTVHIKRIRKQLYTFIAQQKSPCMWPGARVSNCLFCFLFVSLYCYWFFFIWLIPLLHYSISLLFILIHGSVIFSLEKQTNLECDNTRFVLDIFVWDIVMNLECDKGHCALFCYLYFILTCSFQKCINIIL